MSYPPTKASAAEVSPFDAPARWPLALLAGSALVWLVLSSLLALVTSIQLHTPSFLADCSALTHGRAQALRETAALAGSAPWIISLAKGLEAGTHARPSEVMAAARPGAHRGRRMEAASSAAAASAAAAKAAASGP